jgi:hypothetical protein
MPFLVIWYIVFPFWYVAPKKSGNPGRTIIDLPEECIPGDEANEGETDQEDVGKDLQPEQEPLASIH